MREAQNLYNNYIEINNHMVGEINDALDQAYLNLYLALQKLITVLGEIRAYADDDGFLEDNYAKSQEQHTALRTDRRL